MDVVSADSDAVISVEVGEFSSVSVEEGKLSLLVVSVLCTPRSVVVDAPRLVPLISTSEFVVVDTPRSVLVGASKLVLLPSTPEVVAVGAPRLVLLSIPPPLVLIEASAPVLVSTMLSFETVSVDIWLVSSPVLVASSPVCVLEGWYSVVICNDVVADFVWRGSDEDSVDSTDVSLL